MLSRKKTTLICILKYRNWPILELWPLKLKKKEFSIKLGKNYSRPKLFSWGLYTRPFQTKSCFSIPSQPSPDHARPTPDQIQCKNTPDHSSPDLCATKICGTSPVILDISADWCLLDIFKAPSSLCWELSLMLSELFIKSLNLKFWSNKEIYKI